MLREVHVSNLALIHGADVRFEGGLNVLTGETGAGKSILMEAIGLLLGERAFSEQVRTGEDEAEVCGVFELAGQRPRLDRILAENNIRLDNGELIVRRLVARSGRNRIYVNQVPVPLALLRSIGDQLVDLHGQHEHQSLLHPDAGRTLIDAIPTVAPHVERYRTAYAAHTAALQALEEHDARAALLSERRDMIEFQHRELSGLELRKGEEADIEHELGLLSSVTDRAVHAAEMTSLLGGADGGVGQSLGVVHKRLQALAKLDPQAHPWLAELENAQSALSELAKFVESYAERVQSQADPRRVESINERLARLQRLKKKYACDADGLIDKQEQLAADLTSLENCGADRSALERAASAAEAACLVAASSLRDARKQASRAFDKRVSAQMEGLGFAGGAWRTELEPIDKPGPFGAEEIKLTVRTNPGEPFLPLARTASGGEISRLMLAIKTILAERDAIPVLIFDEIDTGIGGTLAHEVARCLRDLSRNHQVLCISHLHQIASIADHHYVVAKETVKGRNQTQVRKLDGDERVAEIARMLGGETEIARRHAQDLLKRGTGIDAH